MAKMQEFKCPCCGGSIEFDSSAQKMKCPFCDTEFDVKTLSEHAKAVEEEQPEDMNWSDEAGSEWQDGEREGLRTYTCKSCGGEIVGDANTAATACPFCGSPVVMTGQLSGALKPDYVIPFKLDKKAAKAAYYKHLEKKSFLPKVFSFENHIDEIVGVYVPFWLFDVDAQAYMTYNAERIRTWRQGNKEHTEHEYYHVDRAGGIEFEHVPTDCSRKMDDALMEAIEPYDFKDAVPFQTPYLAGYVADRYDVNMEECMGRATNRIRQSAEDALRETVKGYQTVTTTNRQINIMSAQYWYAMYPVWVLNTTWKGEKYTFAMNGQTGKMVGDLPADQGAFWKFVGLRGVILGAIIYAVMWIVTLI